MVGGQRVGVLTLGLRYMRTMDRERESEVVMSQRYLGIRPEMTIMYLKCSQKLHLNFEIGGDFWGIWVLCIPKERKNRVFM